LRCAALQCARGRRRRARAPLRGDASSEMIRAALRMSDDHAAVRLGCTCALLLPAAHACGADTIGRDSARADLTCAPSRVFRSFAALRFRRALRRARAHTRAQPRARTRVPCSHGCADERQPAEHGRAHGGGAAAENPSHRCAVRSRPRARTRVGRAWRCWPQLPRRAVCVPVARRHGARRRGGALTERIMRVCACVCVCVCVFARPQWRCGCGRRARRAWRTWRQKCSSAHTHTFLALRRARCVLHTQALCVFWRREQTTHARKRCRRLLKSEDLPYADGPLNLPLDEHPFLATHVEAMHIVDTGAHEKQSTRTHARTKKQPLAKNAPALLLPRARTAPASCRTHALSACTPTHACRR
jgi:hypothetical protein